MLGFTLRNLFVGRDQAPNICARSYIPEDGNIRGQRGKYIKSHKRFKY
jgi:hypothetical protein